MENPVTKLILCLFLIGCQSSISMADDDEKLKSKVSAPANTVAIGSSLGGNYFVDEDLVKQSKALKYELKSIRDKIRSGELTSSDAMKRLEIIGSKRSEIAKAIEEQKVFVAAFNAYTKNETVEFPLGKDKLLIVTGDKVRIRSWEGPGIKCELEKIILAKDQPDDSEFAEIKIVHELGAAAETVGLTAEERDRDEAEFLASEDGRKLNKEQLANRQTFLQEKIYKPQQKYAPFQGKECNQLRLSGLVSNEGNRQLSLVIESEGGGATHSSKWQRHANLTIWVPSCDWILVRGCEVAVDISGVESNLMLTTQGSRENNFEGSFSVSKITGNVVIDQAPIRELFDIDGNVEFIATDEFVNRGTLHQGGARTSRLYETARTIIRGITGNLKAHFLRTDLELENIAGVIDVQNEFGDTSFKLEKTFDKELAHRIISESGAIDISGDNELLTKIPLYAHTMTGILHSNFDRDVLEPLMFSTAGSPQRGWRGFVTPSKERFSFSKFERPGQTLGNEKRTPGLDLISRAGAVQIMGR